MRDVLVEMRGTSYKSEITELKEKMLDVSDREKKIIKAFEICYKEEISALCEKSDRKKENIDKLQMDVMEIQKSVNRLHDVVCCCFHNVL